MDGTLLRGSACLELSRHMGQLTRVNEMEEQWALGNIGHVEFYEYLLPLWTGLDEVGIDTVFAGSAWVDGIEEVWADIAARGEHSAVITLSPQFFADRLLHWGLGSAHGAQVNAGVAPDPALVLSPESKVDVTEHLRRRYGVDIEDCVAYGDSSSDVPLFRRLRHTVAVNATHSLREIAAISYDGGDLREAYAVGRGLLDRTRARP